MLRSTIDIPDRSRTTQNVPKIVCMSFFTGAMGLDIGMRNIGLESILACENNQSNIKPPA